MVGRNKASVPGQGVPLFRLLLVTLSPQLMCKVCQFIVDEQMSKSQTKDQCL